MVYYSSQHFIYRDVTEEEMIEDFLERYYDNHKDDCYDLKITTE
jgi:hypothetical protein